MATPCGRPRDAARKYPADTIVAPRRDGDLAHSRGKAKANGKVRKSPLHATPPTTAAVVVSVNERTTSEIERDDRPGIAEEAACGDGPEIPGVI